MLIRLRSRLIALGVAAATTWAASSSPAQDDETPADAGPAPSAAISAEAKTAPPYRRVPSYFGMVGLSDQQKNDIYAVRGHYQAEIAELKRRIEELSRQEMTECESVLTESQLKLLNQIRATKRPGAGVVPSTGGE